MSVDLSDEEFQSVVEKYQEIMMVTGKKQAIRDIQETDINVESLTEDEKHILASAPLPHKSEYDMDNIDLVVCPDGILYLTRKGLIYRSVLIETEGYEPEYTYNEKMKQVRDNSLF